MLAMLGRHTQNSLENVRFVSVYAQT